MTQMKGYHPINFASAPPGTLLDTNKFRILYIENNLVLNKDNPGLYHQVNTFQTRGNGKNNGIIAAAFKFFLSFVSTEAHQNDADQNDADQKAALVSINNLKSETIAVLNLIRDAFEKDKKKKKHKRMFELEQAVGRLARIFHRPIPPKTSNSSKEWVIYCHKVCLYNENIDESMKLARYLSGHQSNVMKYLGVSLGLIGMLAMMSFILLTVVPSWSGFFSIELAQVGLSGLSTMVSQFLSISTTAANGTIGAAIVGGAISGAMALGGGLLFHNRKATGLSKAMHDVLDKAPKIVVDSISLEPNLFHNEGYLKDSP